MVPNIENKGPLAATAFIMTTMLPAAPSHRRLPDLQALNAFVTVCDSGSMGLAAAIAFGLGGKDVAAEILRDLLKKT